MSDKKNTEIAVNEGFAALANRDVLNEAMADDCQGLEFSFDRVKLPTGGGTAFEIPSAESDETEMAKDITGVIVYNHPAYAYYRDKYTGGNNPPDCGSFDGVTGIGNPGGNCQNCPYNKFGSGEGQSNRYCDTASIMSYGMAWAGSAPGPVSPRSWLEGIYDYASQVMDTEKVFLGMPAYGWNWQIYDLPSNIGKTYRGTSQTYYAAQNWLKGVYNFTDDEPPQPFIPFVGYWDDNNKVPWALPHVYDYMEGRDADSYSYPQMSGTYNGRHYLTAYSKQQKTEFENIIIDHDGGDYASASGIVSIENGIATLGDEGSVTYRFSISTAGTYDVAVRLCYPFWDKNGIYVLLDGATTHYSESRLWWPYWRSTFWTSLASGVSLSAGTHTIRISVDVKGVQFYGFRVCGSFSEEPSAGEATYSFSPRQFKDVEGNMVGPDRGFRLTLERCV